ncbi:hypothetical protein PBAL39_21140 [Pedobacter sp. BAL39]|uniref:barstar family protein n=1 Tax=Pedobacter sp. BAL39 TaxID=391596 RepID=UPI000155997E|nr:hypothetical protein [Pedobacter sp. BAL39]EDM38619.1 hypothetical protein PBAL39_21140 [Pedobacter sp. BAL39]
MGKEIIIEGSHIHDIVSFYEEVNRVFVVEDDWKIGNSLDAFNDLLYRATGDMKGGESARLLWNDMEQSREALGYAATKAYYLEKLGPDSVYNKKHFEEKLAALESGDGQTYFDVILEIIAEHPRIELMQ